MNAQETITTGGIPTGYVDVLTGKAIYQTDPAHGLCPRCKTHSVISDQPSSERCLKCGWNDES